MNRVLKNYRLPENIEVLFLLVMGIILQITDGSPFTIKKRWAVVWDTELPSENFSVFTQQLIKTILSGIVVARCLTTYAYVVSAMLVIFCILKDAAPKIILIWLIISGLKSICMTFVEALIGVYVCSAFGKIRKACVEFFISKALEITFATYLWGSVLNMYYDMMRRREEELEFENWDEYFKQMYFKRQRARSLLDESVLNRTAHFNTFEFKDVPQIMLQMLRREEDMSQDSLLGPGMMLASVSNMGSSDNIKKAQSLGELGTMDLRSVRVMDMDEDKSNTPTQKALKFLKLSWSDIRKAKERKNEEKNDERYKDISSIDDKIWNEVANDPAPIHQPKGTRGAIVIQEIPNADLDEEIELKREKFPKIELELKFGFSLFNFLREKDDEYLKGKEEEEEEEEEDKEQKESEEQENDELCPDTLNVEEEEHEKEKLEEDGSTRFFMSNIKEEVAVNRIRLDFVSKAIKGDHYAKLYKKDYMNSIGHEVFDRESKLLKVTSLSQVIKKYGKKRESSLRISSDTAKKKRKINFGEENSSRSSLSSSNLETFKEGELKNVEATSNSLESFSDAKSSQENEDNSLVITDNAVVEKEEETKEECFNLKIAIKKLLDREITPIKVKDLCNRMILEKTKKLESDENEDLMETKEKEKNSSFRGKRKIKIKRIGRKKEEPLKMRAEIFDEPCCDDGYLSPIKPSSRVRKSRSTSETKLQKSLSATSPSSARITDKDATGFRSSRQAYFVSKLSHQPVARFLESYYDLKKKLSHEQFQDYFAEKSMVERQKSEDFENFLDSCFYKNKNCSRVWKSRVLKTAAIYQKAITKPSETVDNYQNRQTRIYSDCVLESLLEKPFYYLMLSYLVKTKKHYDIEKPESSFEEKLESKAHDLNVNDWDTLNYERSRSYVSSGSSYISLVLNKPFTTSDTSFFTVGDDLIGETKCTSSTSRILRWVNSSFSVDSNFLSIAKTEEQSETKIETESKASKLPNSYSKEPVDESEFLTAPSTSKKVNFTIKSKYNKKKGEKEEEEEEEEEEENVTKQDSDESFSLFYSKAADLASPLLDMKRFIYPDHIHYSYKHVKKKGFDVDISGGLPLLVRESLTSSSPLHVKKVSTSPNLKVEITRRPMDLSFATTSEFAEWNYQDPTDGFPVEELPQLQDNESEKILGKSKKVWSGKGNRAKNSKKSKNLLTGNYGNQKSGGKTAGSFKATNSSKNNFLLEKLCRIYRKLGQAKGGKTREQDRQLHSNKGRIVLNYNPAVILNENKTGAEKKKLNTQEERTKNMFFRLGKEALLQNKNFQKVFDTKL